MHTHSNTNTLPKTTTITMRLEAGGLQFIRGSVRSGSGLSPEWRQNSSSLYIKFWSWTFNAPGFPAPIAFRKCITLVCIWTFKKRKTGITWKNSDFARKFHQIFHVVVALYNFSPTLMTINHKVLYIYGNVLTWGTSEWL